MSISFLLTIIKIVRTPHTLKHFYPFTAVPTNKIAKLLFEGAQFSMGTFGRALTSYGDTVALRVAYTRLTVG
jgi:hypothetical protein